MRVSAILSLVELLNTVDDSKTSSNEFVITNYHKDIPDTPLLDKQLRDSGRSQWKFNREKHNAKKR
jgi:hypothetical protein